MKSLIYFGGPISSGKSFCSEYLISKYGYKKISFADPLKSICSEVTKIPIDYFYTVEGKEEKRFIEFTYNMYNQVCDFFKISFKKSKVQQSFSSIRDMLQYIGTDYVRLINRDAHVNKMFETYTNSLSSVHTYFVVDDVRFKNEVEVLNNLNGFGIYIINPSITHKHPHESESSLTWQNFDLSIVNDKNLETYELYETLDKVVVN